MSDAGGGAGGPAAAPAVPAAPVAAPAAERVAELRRRLVAVRHRIEGARVAAGRAPGSVTLVAVTKTWPASDVLALLATGPDAPRDLGEARDQEAARKVRELAEAGVEGLRWHVVGRLQTNKARSVARYASAVHSVDRVPLVAALADGARRAGREVAVLVQLSLDGDPNRGGVPEGELGPVADAAAGSEGLRLAGLMAVAPRGADPAAAFDRVAAVAARLRADHPGATWLSAGMSGDLEEAVARGATHLRVGSALFGGRPPLPG